MVYCLARQEKKKKAAAAQQAQQERSQMFHSEAMYNLRILCFIGAHVFNCD